MRLTGLALIPAALVLAAPAFAQGMNANQQAVYDVILPALEESLAEQGGTSYAALAPMLASCIVAEAKRRELRTLADGALGEDDTQLLNQIMARPDTQGCVAKAAGQG
ncbi:MAG: hypothetical protein AAGF78_00710 [Pseudomonadota bacterium]